LILACYISDIRVGTDCSTYLVSPRTSIHPRTGIVDEEYWLEM
jgi:hypothetical protein